MCLVEKSLKDMEELWSLQGMSAILVWRVDGLVPAAATEAVVQRIVERLVGRL